MQEIKNITFPEPDNGAENWEIAIGGNFLQVWETGRYEKMQCLSFEDGKVADVAIANVHLYDRNDERYINYEQAIADAMPRAHLIACAPAMLALLEKAFPIIEAEANRRDDAPMPDDDSPEGIKGYRTEMRQLVNEVARAIELAHGRPKGEIEIKWI